MAVTPIQRSILLGIILISGLAAITASGVLHNSNIVMSDQLFRAFPNHQTTPAILLISTTKLDRLSPSLIEELTISLKKSEPRRLFLLDPDTAISLSKLPHKKWMDDITFLDSVTRIENTPQSESKEHANINLGYMTAIKLHAGHFRNWQRSYKIKDDNYIAFQAEITSPDKPRTVIPTPKAMATIDFSMEDGLIPLVKAKRVIQEGLATSLIKNKIILIGEALEPGQPGFTVPIRPNLGISQLELQGYALHSAISKRFLSFAGFSTTLIGTLLISSISILLFQWLSPQYSAIYTVSICLFLVTLQWLSIKLYALILPTWEWIIVQVLTLLTVYQLRRNKEERALSRIIAETNDRLSERVQPLNFNRADDPWKKVLSFINQQLNLRRSIFLEKIINEHRLIEIEALNCSIDDISEFRRDYQRKPYSDALEVNGPIIPFRDYFKEVENDEIQYLIPLTFAGEILGFWALTLMPDKKFDKVLFENNLRNFANQIAELIYHRNHWKLDSKKHQNPWRRLLSLELGQTLHRQLNQSVTLLEHRLDTLEDVFNGLSTAAVVYDVFGQVLHTNSVIEYLARINDIAIYKLTAMELLAKTAEISLDESRKKLRYVTLKNKTLAISSRVLSSHSAHLLRIRPLLSLKKPKTDQIHPFQILGILFEFIDISQIQQHIDIRQDVSEKYFYLMRNKLSTISLANRKISKENTSISQWTDMIKKHIIESGDLTNKIEDELKKNIYLNEQEVVPINIASTISRLLDSAEELAQHKELEFLYHKPDLNTLSYVELQTFEQLINAILKLLINDAAHQSIISIIILDQSEQEDKKIKINFTNMGNGVPKEHLNNLLATPHLHTDNQDDPLTQISILTQQINYWGGELSILTDIGSGFSIDLELKTFNFASKLNNDLGKS